MFKKYECGCVGFVLNAMATEPNAKQVYCFKACDGEPRELSIERRDTLQDKPSRKLTDEEIEKLFEELSDLVRDGHSLHELRMAMRAAGIGS